MQKAQKFEEFNPYALYSLYEFDKYKEGLFRVDSWKESDIAENAKSIYDLMREIKQKIYNEKCLI